MVKEIRDKTQITFTTEKHDITHTHSFSHSRLKKKLTYDATADILTPTFSKLTANTAKCISRFNIPPLSSFAVVVRKLKYILSPFIILIMTDNLLQK